MTYTLSAPQRREVRLERRTIDRELWVRATPPPGTPNVSLSAEGVQQLVFCRDIVRHILPDEMLQEVQEAIGATTFLLGDEASRKALGQSGNDIAGAEGDQLLIGIDLVAVAPRKALGGQYPAGKADQNNAGGVVKQRDG